MTAARRRQLHAPDRWPWRRLARLPGGLVAHSAGHRWVEAQPGRRRRSLARPYSRWLRGAASRRTAQSGPQAPGGTRGLRSQAAADDTAGAGRRCGVGQAGRVRRYWRRLAIGSRPTRCAIWRCDPGDRRCAGRGRHSALPAPDFHEQPDLTKASPQQIWDLVRLAGDRDPRRLEGRGFRWCCSAAARCWPRRGPSVCRAAR